MRHASSRARRAFTLVEVLVAIVVLGIIGGALVKLIISQSRFTEKAMARRNARTVSRNAMNIMLTDLRMVQDIGGLVAAGREGPDADGLPRDSVTVRVPIAFGLFCDRSGGTTTISLLPVDSAMTALGYYNGYAVRDGTSEIYSYTPANARKFTTIDTLPWSSTLCSTGLLGTGPGITQITSNGRRGKIITVGENPSGTYSPGWPAFVYQQVTYRFEPSKAFAGRIGLFRKLRTGTGSNDWKIDEIIAPFDTSAGFRYYVLNEDTAQVAVPASLGAVRGLQLYLAGSSPRVPVNENAAKQALVTGVFFKNRRDP